MKKLSLQELKEIELDILKMFDAFCKENDIKYFLAEETIYPSKDIALGVEIDIFPLDTFDNDIQKAKKEAKLSHKYMGCLGYTKLKKFEQIILLNLLLGVLLCCSIRC